MRTKACPRPKSPRVRTTVLQWKYRNRNCIQIQTPQLTVHLYMSFIFNNFIRSFNMNFVNSLSEGSMMEGTSDEKNCIAKKRNIYQHSPILAGGFSNTYDPKTGGRGKVTFEELSICLNKQIGHDSNLLETPDQIMNKAKIDTKDNRTTETETTSASNYLKQDSKKHEVTRRAFFETNVLKEITKNVNVKLHCNDLKSFQAQPSNRQQSKKSMADYQRILRFLDEKYSNMEESSTNFSKRVNRKSESSDERHDNSDEYLTKEYCCTTLHKLAPQPEKIHNFAKDETASKHIHPSSYLTPPLYQKNDVFNTKYNIEDLEEDSLQLLSNLEQLTYIDSPGLQKRRVGGFYGSLENMTNATFADTSLECFEKLEQQCNDMFPNDLEQKPILKAASSSCLFKCDDLHRKAKQQMAALDSTETRQKPAFNFLSSVLPRYNGKVNCATIEDSLFKCERASSKKNDKPFQKLSNVPPKNIVGHTYKKKRILFPDMHCKT